MCYDKTTREVNLVGRVAQTANVEGYCEMFHSMKRNICRGHHAPHKPILLLAVAELIADGTIADNRITLSDALIERFNALWRSLVEGKGDTIMTVSRQMSKLLFEEPYSYPFKASIENPFYYMSYEPFWHLHKSEQWVQRSGYSLASLRRCYSHASLDEPLFLLFSDEVSRATLVQTLRLIV